MRRAKHITLILTAAMIVASTQLVISQNSTVDITKLPAHIVLKNSFVGVNTQEYVDAITKADFDRYRYQDKIRILKFESGIEFQLLPVNGNANAETESNYKATLKLLPSGKIVQLVPYEPNSKDSPSGVLKPSNVIEEEPGAKKSGNPQVNYSTAPAEMPAKSTGNDRLKQLVEMRKKASETGAPLDKYDKAIEALRKKLAEQKNSE